MIFRHFSKDMLVHLLNCYDQYIQDWCETHTEGAPACIKEFVNNEYKEITDGGYEDYTDWLNCQD